MIEASDASVAKSMKRLCRASNLPEAHILRAVLEQSGIQSRIFNEHAQSGVGQLPVMEAYPELWVNEEDEARASSVVDAFQRAPSENVVRACPACGEESPGNFQVCWNCGAGL